MLVKNKALRQWRRRNGGRGVLVRFSSSSPLACLHFLGGPLQALARSHVKDVQSETESNVRMPTRDGQIDEEQKRSRRELKEGHRV